MMWWKGEEEMCEEFKVSTSSLRSSSTEDVPLLQGNTEETEMAWLRYSYRELLPFTCMVMVECSDVGLNTLFKAATMRGMSYYVYVVYSYAIATFVLIPFAFISYRIAALPSFNFSLFCRICLLGIIGTSTEILGSIGINYSSPTLSSAISNLMPAFTFIFALIFRMERLALKSTSSRFKIMGTLVSIAGAFVVTLYKGPTIISTTKSSSNSDHQSLSSSKSNFVLGGIFLAADNLLLSIWYILQAQVLRDYPSELIIVFLYNSCTTVICTAVCLIAEKNLKAWEVRPDISLAAIIYSGLVGSFFSTTVETWALGLKGPVYVAMFKPLSIVIAAAMGVMFLGDTLYLGSIIGAIIISIGFYAVIRGKAKEDAKKEMGENLSAQTREQDQEQERAQIYPT